MPQEPGPALALTHGKKESQGGRDLPGITRDDGSSAGSPKLPDRWPRTPAASRPGHPGKAGCGRGKTQAERSAWAGPGEHREDWGRQCWGWGESSPEHGLLGPPRSGAQTNSERATVPHPPVQQRLLRKISQNTPKSPGFLPQGAGKKGTEGKRQERRPLGDIRAPLCTLRPCFCSPPCLPSPPHPLPQGPFSNALPSSNTSVPYPGSRASKRQVLPQHLPLSWGAEPSSGAGTQSPPTGPLCTQPSPRPVPCLQAAWSKRLTPTQTLEPLAHTSIASYATKSYLISFPSQNGPLEDMEA